MDLGLRRLPRTRSEPANQRISKSGSSVADVVRAAVAALVGPHDGEPIATPPAGLSDRLFLCVLLLACTRAGHRVAAALGPAGAAVAHQWRGGMRPPPGVQLFSPAETRRAATRQGAEQYLASDRVEGMRCPQCSQNFGSMPVSTELTGARYRGRVKGRRLLSFGTALWPEGSNYSIPGLTCGYRQGEAPVHGAQLPVALGSSCRGARPGSSDGRGG